MVGVPGVGKTTIVQSVQSRLGEARVVVFGTVMLGEGRRLKWVRHRDELRNIPVERQKRLQRIAAEKISRIKGGLILVDTHLFIRTPEGFWSGLPFEVIRALKPTHLILVESTSTEVLARRSRDTLRYRDRLTRQEVEFELTLAREFLVSSAMVSGAPMLIVNNREGKVDEAVNRVVEVLRGASR